MTSRPTMVTNQFDRLELPRRLQGVVAPVAVWEYVAQLQRRVVKLEEEIRARAAHEATHKR